MVYRLAVALVLVLACPGWASEIRDFREDG
jgi:hypothetical protein